MPAVLSLIILLAVLYMFVLFVRTASPNQMGRILGVAALTIVIGGLILLAFTGRLPAALLILIILWPMMAAYFDRRRRVVIAKHAQHPDEDGSKKEQIKHDFDQNS